MTATVERIRKEASLLPYDERETLVRVLELDLDSTAPDDENSTEVEAAWDAEIDSRVKEIEEGKVELVSAEDAERRIRAKLAERRTSQTSAT